jgi:putative ABC transport system substrate-binding protein
MLDTKRREVIALLGAGGLLLAVKIRRARAQQPAMPVVGFLYDGSLQPIEAYGAAAFRKGLSEMGYVEGRNVAIEYRSAQNENKGLSELATDLVRRRVGIIATPGSPTAAVAAKSATTTIPIVFGTGSDPVKDGLVASLNRPGGNITGVSTMNLELGPKRLGLLVELMPGATRFAVLVNPNSPNTEAHITDVRAAAAILGVQVETLMAKTNLDIDANFASLGQKRVEALLVSAGPPFGQRRAQLATLAARHGVPTIYPDRMYAEAGGLMSYGSNVIEMYRLAGIYTGRILKGENPAEMPVIQAAKFEFIINIHTAKLLGLDVPATLLARADEVID